MHSQLPRDTTTSELQKDVKLLQDLIYNNRTSVRAKRMLSWAVKLVKLSGA